MRASDLIQLKSLKVHNDMSEETMCFSAEVVMGGKVIGDVRNDGRGGCNNISIQPEHRKAFNEAVAKYKAHFKPKYDFEMDCQLIDAVIEEMQIEKDCKTKTLFRYKGKTLEMSALYTPKVRAEILKEYPGAEILNKEFVSEDKVKEQEKKRLMRMCKTKLVFKLKGSEDVCFYPMPKALRNPIGVRKMCEKLREKHGNDIEHIYNIGIPY